MPGALMVINPEDRPFEANPMRRNIAVRKPRAKKGGIHIYLRGDEPVVASGTRDTGVNMPPFQYVEAVATRGDLGLIAHGAYNAYGLIGPEKGGVALVNRKAHDVVGTLAVPYDPARRMEILQDIYASRDWAASAERWGFDMRYRPNPGARWHLEHADEARSLAASSKLDRDRHYFQGKEAAHLESWGSSRYRRKGNPEKAKPLGKALLGLAGYGLLKGAAASMGTKAAAALAANPRRWPSPNWQRAFSDSFIRITGHKPTSQDETWAVIAYQQGISARRAAEQIGGRMRAPTRDEEPRIGNPTSFRGFHGADPDKAYKVKTPANWPRKLWMLGRLNKLTMTNGSVLAGGTVAAGRGDTIYLIGAMGRVRGGSRVAQIEYTPPKVSSKAGATYFHPFDRPPVLRSCGRGCYTVTGRGIRLTPRGIVG